MAITLLDLDSKQLYQRMIKFCMFDVDQRFRYAKQNLKAKKKSATNIQLHI